MSMLFKMVCKANTGLVPRQAMHFAGIVPDVPNQIFHNPNANKYQESRMLFFGKKLQDKQKVDATRPKSI